MTAPNDGLPDDVLGDLLAFVLAGTHERVADGVLRTQPPPIRAALGGVYDTVAALALAARRSAPPHALRTRLMATLAKNGAWKAQRALVIVDMIKDHLTPGCPLEVPRARNVIAAMRARIEQARANGIPVVYVVDEHDADDPDLDAWGAHAVRGSGGNEVWPDLAPMPGDHIVTKPTFSAFERSELAMVMDQLRVDTIVLTGCLTEIGLMATATDAMQRGFEVEVPPDSQAGSSAEAEMVTLGVIKVMAPYGAARKARLEMLADRAA